MMTDSMPVVKVSEELLEQARELQRIRNPDGYTNAKSVNKNPTQDHYVGAIGELIVADWFDESVDWEEKYGDDGIDITHDTGGDMGEISIDVKSTKHSTGSMITPENVAHEIKTSDKKQQPTIYVLVRRKSGNKYEIAGWETSDTFLAESTLCPMLNNSSGKNHKLDADDLYNLQAPKDDLDLCQLVQAGDSQFVTESAEA